MAASRLGVYMGAEEEEAAVVVFTREIRQGCVLSSKRNTRNIDPNHGWTRSSTWLILNEYLIV